MSSPYYIQNHLLMCKFLIIRIDMNVDTKPPHLILQTALRDGHSEKTISVLQMRKSRYKGDVTWPRSLSFDQFSSVAQSCLTICDPHGLQHTRPSCPSPTPGVYLNSCPLSRWRHPAISSSVIPFSSCLQSFPALGSFQMSQFFASGGQSIGVSASASLLPMNIQGWFPLRWTGWISLQSKGLILKSLLQHHSSKASILQHSAFLIVQLSHPYMTTGKTIALTRWTIFGKVMSLLLNMLSRLVITFLPRSKLLLISWLQLPSAVMNFDNQA